MCILGIAASWRDYSQFTLDHSLVVAAVVLFTSLLHLGLPTWGVPDFLRDFRLYTKRLAVGKQDGNHVYRHIYPGVTDEPIMIL